MTSRAKPLSDVPDGERVFVDANVFVYHFTGVSDACSALLERCERQTVAGFTGPHVLLELLHRLMMIEAVTRGLVSAGNVAKKLRAKPEVVSQLHLYREQADAVLAMGVEVPPLSSALVQRSASWRAQHGFLVHDALTLALMEAEGVRALASADADFGRARALRRYAPHDLGR